MEEKLNALLRCISHLRKGRAWKPSHQEDGPKQLGRGSRKEKRETPFLRHGTIRPNEIWVKNQKKLNALT